MIKSKTLNKRINTVLRSRRILLAASAIITLTIILSTAISVNASSKINHESLNTYYTSIQVKAGDTLWTIADDYMTYQDISKADYVENIKKINNLNSDSVDAGDFIIVSYLATSPKY